MNKSQELKTATKIVREMLEKYPETRNSDDMLYFRVCESIDDVILNSPFWKVLINRKQYNYPAYESVRRTRQKLQAAFPELAGCDEVEAERVLNEAIYREFARRGSVL